MRYYCVSIMIYRVKKREIRGCFGRLFSRDRIRVFLIRWVTFRRVFIVLGYSDKGLYEVLYECDRSVGNWL